MNASRILAFLTAAIVVGFLLAAPSFLKSYGVYLLALWATTSISALGLNLTDRKSVV